MPPAPKPTELKRLQGNPGHQRLPEPVVVIEGGFGRIPKPPASLAAAGKRRWEQVWATADPWLIHDLDVGLLERYCEALDERAYWQGVIKREGRMSEGSMRQPKVHPAVEELHKLDDRLTKWEGELGLSPVGRSRLHVEKRQPKEDKLAKYLA